MDHSSFIFSPCFQDRHDDESGDDKSGSEDGKKKRKRPMKQQLVGLGCISFSNVRIHGWDAETKRRGSETWQQPLMNYGEM